MSQSSQVIRWVKNLPAMQDTQEMQVRSLGWEDTLEKLSNLNHQHSCQMSLGRDYCPPPLLIENHYI